jgi:dTDP-4-dehydrorhamnose 3,5-epimerase-like enzyme
MRLISAESLNLRRAALGNPTYNAKPAGMAHGFLVLSDSAELLYKTTDYWAPEHERCIIWNDPTLAIEWAALQ